MTDILHFKRDMTAIDRDQMLGPDMHKRRLAIKSVDYDPDTGVSTVALRAILPDEYRQRLEVLTAQAREYARIRELFRG